jgi:hypothetical protein
MGEDHCSPTNEPMTDRNYYITMNGRRATADRSHAETLELGRKLQAEFPGSVFELMQFDPATGHGRPLQA